MGALAEVEDAVAVVVVVDPQMLTHQVGAAGKWCILALQIEDTMAGGCRHQLLLVIGL